jgi:hypothetical protein
VKLLELLKNHVGDEFPGVVTGITNFGLFIQLQTYLIDGLIRYENLLANGGMSTIAPAWCAASAPENKSTSAIR